MLYYIEDAQQCIICRDVRFNYGDKWSMWTSEQKLSKHQKEYKGSFSIGLCDNFDCIEERAKFIAECNSS